MRGLIARVNHWIAEVRFVTRRLTPLFLIVWSLSLAGLPAQEGSPSSDPAQPKLERLDVHGLSVLLKVGVPEREILAHGRRRGWPEGLSQADFVALDRLGPGPLLRSALLSRLDRRVAKGGNESKWKATSIDLLAPEGHRLSILEPRGWFRERGEGTDRLAFRPRREREPWLEAPRAFLWVESLEDAKVERVAGLARLAYDALKTALGRSELSFDEPNSDLLVGPISGRDYPLLDGFVQRQNNARRGRVLIGARIDVDQGVAIMAGIITGLPETAEDLPERPRQTLARLLDSCRVTPLINGN